VIALLLAAMIGTGGPDLVEVHHVDVVESNTIVYLDDGLDPFGNGPSRSELRQVVWLQWYPGLREYCVVDVALTAELTEAGKDTYYIRDGACITIVRARTSCRTWDSKDRYPYETIHLSPLHRALKP